MFKTCLALFTIKNKRKYNTSDFKLNFTKDQNQKEVQTESFRNLNVCEYNGKGNNESLLFNTCKKYADMENFTFISPIPEERYKDVFKHLKTHLPKGLNSQVKLEGYSLDSVQNQLSVMVTKRDDDQVIAVALNGIKVPGDVEQRKETLRTMTQDQYNQTYDLIETLRNSVDLFFKYNVDKIFNIEVLSVNKNYEESEFAKEIMKRIEAVAKENEYKIMMTETSDPSLNNADYDD